MKKLCFLLLLFVSSIVFTINTFSKNNKISSINDLSGKRVGVQTGTLYENFIMEKNKDVIIEFYSDSNIMICALRDGKIDAYITEEASLLHEKKLVDGLDYIKLDGATSKISIGISDVINQDILKSQIEEFIEYYQANNECNEMKSYWFDNLSVEKCEVNREGITGINGKLKIGFESSFVPFSFISNNEFVGYDIDFIYRFCRKYGYEPILQPMSYDALSPAIATGKCDLGMNILYYSDREEEITLTKPYYELDLLIGFIPKKNVEKFSINKIFNSINKTFIVDNRWQLFLSGIVISILISGMAIIFGTILGFIVYLTYRRKNKIFCLVVDKIRWLLNGTPTVVLLMIFYFIIFGKFDIEKVIVAIITFTFIFASSVIEMLDNSEETVGKGQLECALSQGFTDNGAYLKVILPQSAIYFLPNYNDEIISLIKETSIVGYIAILDLTKITDMVRGMTFEPFFPLIANAAFYFFIAWLLTILVKVIQIKINPKTRNIDKIFKDINVRQ